MFVDETLITHIHLHTHTHTHPRHDIIPLHAARGIINTAVGTDGAAAAAPTVHCPTGQFMCGDRRTCISIVGRCDRKVDCPHDRRDEDACRMFAPCVYLCPCWNRIRDAFEIMTRLFLRLFCPPMCLLSLVCLRVCVCVCV